MKYLVRPPWTDRFRALVLFRSLFLAATGRAQLVADGATGTVANPGSHWRLIGGIEVGGTGSGNRLVNSNGATLATAGSNFFGANCYIGHVSTASNNEAVVTGIPQRFFRLSTP